MATSEINGVIQHLRRAALLGDGAGLTDGQLLEGFVSRRDDAALAALLQRHGPMVWGVCRRVLTNYHDAENAFQATFLVLVRRAASIAAPELLANWLYGVAHQTALKARATVARRRERERQVAEMPEPAAVERDLWNDLRTVLDQELSRLSDIYRAVIVLCDLEGKTRKEAAGHLGLPEGTVASRLARARTLLAKRLTDRGVTLSAGSLAAVLGQHAVTSAAPDAVMSSTLRAASVFAAGHATAGVISPAVAALAGRVLKAMLVSKLRPVVAVALLVGIIATGATILAHDTTPPVPIAGPVTAATVYAHGTDAPAPIPGAIPARPIVVRQDAMLQRMALSTDGAVVATVGINHDGAAYNGTVKLWDARTGDLKRALDEEKESNPVIAFSRDLLAIGLNGKAKEVRLLDAKTLELKHRITETHVPNLFGWSSFAFPPHIAFSPDGKRLALAGSTHRDRFVPFLKLWDVEKHSLIDANADVGEIPEELERVFYLAYSPDGTVVAAAWEDGKIRLFDGHTGSYRSVLDPELIAGLEGPAGIAFSPDSKTLICKGGHNTVVLWDPAEDKPRRSLNGHEGEIVALAVSGDGRWIASGGRTATDGVYEVILWDARTGTMKHTFPDQPEWVHAMSFSPDGKTLAVCDGGGRYTRGKQSIISSGALRLFPLEELFEMEPVGGPRLSFAPRERRLIPK
jgi:RNA polymerase sigma factor (sigma-70 family)